MDDTGVGAALRAWSLFVANGGSPEEADLVAVRTLADVPWQAATVAALLLASRPERAPADYGLTASFRIRDPRGAGVVATFARGSLFPAWDPDEIMEPQRDLAVRVADAARSVAEGTFRRAVVLGGGVGAFALALEAWGILEIEVVEHDARARALHEAVAPRARLVQAPTGSFDLVVAKAPHIGRAFGQARPGGGIAAFIPASALDDAEGVEWRRRLVQTHRVRALSGPLTRPGAPEPWWILSALSGGGPAEVLGVPAERVLADPRITLRR